MDIRILKDVELMGAEASAVASNLIKEFIAKNGHCNIILATGASQFSVLKNLVKEDIEWSKVTMFHLDEYIDLPENHAASFRRYLHERFVDKIDGVCEYYFIDGNYRDPEEECERIANIIRKHPIDVALIGIGENAHIAFNDPPADFEIETPYIVVDLDEACRQQQFGEGWFDRLEEVPKQAISMSIKHIMKSKHLIVSVPDARKAAAVRQAVEGPLSDFCPASILREHEACILFLDNASASQLSQ